MKIFINNFKFGTKAETLEALMPLVKTAIINDLYYFSVEKWRVDSRFVLNEISFRFRNFRYLVVRSSAQNEDGNEESMAGAFESYLNVDCGDPVSIEQAINKVISSFFGNLSDQVLIQPMVSDIAVSGVIMTHSLEDGAPYYVINYDDNSGKTDSVTGGTGVHKTVFVSRRYEQKYLKSPRLRKMLELACELEEICGQVPLNIEFGIKGDGEVHLFQVRPISISKNWHSDIAGRVNRVFPVIENFIKEKSEGKAGILGKRTILATMSDWNPAEIIGTTPNPLAVSLYRELITQSVWRIARARMGYRILPSAELMVMIYGRPYIDVRNSFNSFLPDGLNDSISLRLVEAWLDCLEGHPELHDKIEFDIAHTCLNFTFDQDFTLRYPGLLSSQENAEYKKSLLLLTRRCLDISSAGTLVAFLSNIDELAQKQSQIDYAPKHFKSANEALNYILKLLNDCKDLGTFAFSIIARHAFIAESLLISAVKREAISVERIKVFKRSLRTVTYKFTQDYSLACKGEVSLEEFMRSYGHLRPGTYDITSLRYADRDGLFTANSVDKEDSNVIPFSLNAGEKKAINYLLAEAGLVDTDADKLFTYARMAITGREYAKFVFTKNLSDALENLVQWGKFFEFNREDLAFLDLESISNIPVNAQPKNVKKYLSGIIEKNKSYIDNARGIKLSHIIRGINDIYIIPLHRSIPNFIGSRRVEGPIVVLSAKTSLEVNLSGKIICIENADPGFDWVFTKGINGLITKYGGVNSHMAIRCAEFGLPAAIGCGEGPFERIVEAGMALLNCADKILKPLYAH